MQCQVCQQSLRGEREQGSWSEPGKFSYSHHESAIDIRTAAHRGCHLCSVFWSLLSPEEISKILGHDKDVRGDLGRTNITKCDPVRISVSVREATLGDAGETTLQIAFPLEYPEFDDWYGRFCVKHVGLMPAQEIEQLGHDHEITHNTATDANFALAKTWLNTCVSNHASCSDHGSVGELWFPTRLIEIDHRGDDSEVRIVIPSSHLPTSPYMTLSHCWGSARFPKLTMGNLETMKSRVAVLTLPNTFRHAIHITRRLGLKYLWIDALCIIQDSVEDWQREAATMRNVYKYAFCNIAATGAADSTVGCFWDRNPLLVRPCKVDITWDLPLTGSHYCVDRSLWTKNVGEAPLNRRAWVAQERLLSPRILHFGSQQLFWECRELEACESYPCGIPRSRDPLSFVVRTGLKRLNPSEKRRAQEGVSSSMSKFTFDALEYWTGIVDLYTRSSLTRKEDKLIAISGVAKEMRFILDDVYLAGLWKNQLPTQLLWFVSRPLIADNGRPSSRPDIYRSPSWSWPSIDGAVVPGNLSRNDDWDLLPTYLDASIDHLGDDSTLQVTGGRIRVRGFLKPATWECLWAGRLYELFPGGEKTESNTFWPDEILFSLPAEVFCLPVLSRYWDHTRFIDGLVLASTENPDEFRRVGKFRAQDEDDCRLFLKHKFAFSSPSTAGFNDLEERCFTII